MDLAGADAPPARAGNRNFTVAVGGKQFDPLECDDDVLRKGERSNTLPATTMRRADVDLKESDLKILEEKQAMLKGRVRRGSIFLGSVNETELEGFWEANPKVELHVSWCSYSYFGLKMKMKLMMTGPKWLLLHGVVHRILTN